VKHLSAAQPAGTAGGKPDREQAAEKEDSWKTDGQVHIPALAVKGQF